MFCPRCQKEVGDAKFCPDCGSSTTDNSTPANNMQLTPATPPPKQENKWYRQPGGIILLLIFFFPVGLYLMWKYTNWSKNAKIVVSAIIGVFVIISAAMPREDTLQPVSNLSSNADINSSSSSSTTTTTTATTTTTETPEDAVAVFDPDIQTDVDGANITITATQDAPDGTLLQFTVMSGTLEENYSETIPIESGKASFTFEVTNTDPKLYIAMVTLQFNAPTLKQPQNVIDYYGKHAEKLSGPDVTGDAQFEDGETGNIAMISFTISYPSEEALKEALEETRQETFQTIINNSEGVILDITVDDDTIYTLYVSNSAWYLASEEEKQYSAEEFLKYMKQLHKSLFGTDTIVLSIVAENGKEVAVSKIFGGMKVKS